MCPNPICCEYWEAILKCWPLCNAKFGASLGRNVSEEPTIREHCVSMSSIKRDVKKKVLPRPDAEKLFVSRSSPLPVSVPLDLLERFVLACLPFPWLFIFRW